MAAELETGWNLDTKSRRDTCSSELRTAKPRILIANPPRPLFLKLHFYNIWKSSQLESTENTVITTRSQFIFALRECSEQMHRGDHSIFEHPSNASSWRKLNIREPIARSNESEVNLFLTRSMAGVRPRGSVGAAWHAMKDAKTKPKASRSTPRTATILRKRNVSVRERRDVVKRKRRS